MTEKAPERIWPDKLRVRDTGLYDDMGGAGQRIYTTAGQGYEKREYVPATALEAAQARVQALEDTLNIERALSDGAHRRARAARREALEEAAKVLDRRVRKICDEVGSYDSTTNHVELPEWAETACEELEAQAAAIRALMENPNG